MRSKCVRRTAKTPAKASTRVSEAEKKKEGQIVRLLTHMSELLCLAVNYIEYATRFQFDPITVELRDSENKLWAVMWQGCVLTKPTQKFKQGRFVYEPLPSARTVQFRKRTRFALDDAIALAKNWQEVYLLNKKI